jgi:predicted TIM-barrel fold metal-dependent hydrolase
MVIDFHTHVFPGFFRRQRERFFSGEPGYKALYGQTEARLAGVNDLLKSMDDEEVERSVIFGFPWENPEYYRRHNDYIIEAAQTHPKRLTGFCCFSPLSKGGPEEAERCLKAGLDGVGELALYSPGSLFESKNPLREVVAVCSRLDAPLVLHTSEPVGHEYPGKVPMEPRELYAFIKACPSNRIVLAHWGGGLFLYALMIKEVKEVFQNVWFDTAASPYLYSPEIYRIAGEIIGFEKILFGSDYPLLRPQRYLKEMSSIGLSHRSIRQMTRLNAQQLLGLTD